MSKGKKHEIIEGIRGVSGFGTYLIPGMNAALSTAVKKPVAPETQTVANVLGRFDYMPWGNNNLRPFEIFEMVEKSAQVGAIIKKKVELLTSGGFMYGHVVLDENGARHYVPKIIPEIEEFMERTQANRYLEEAAIDLYTLNNPFPEFSKDLKGRIVGIYNNDSSECRLGLQESTGRIPKVFVSANWRDTYSTADAITVAALDPYFDVVGQIKSGKDFKYILPHRLQTRGRKYYQRAEIENLKDSGWLDIAKSIPLWKKAIMEFQISIKYQIVVAEEHWNKKYPNFNKESISKQREIEANEINKFLDFFAKKQGGTHLTTKSRVGNNEFVNWEIKPIGGDKQFGDGAYIEDATQSDFQIARGMGIHPSLLGVSPGKNFSAGSGSDIRMAYNAHIIGCKPDQRKLLWPFEIASAVNGWNEKYGGEHKKLHWWTENFFLVTLDHGSDAKKSNQES